MEYKKRYILKDPNYLHYGGYRPRRNYKLSEQVGGGVVLADDALEAIKFIGGTYQEHRFKGHLYNITKITITHFFIVFHMQGTTTEKSDGSKKNIKKILSLVITVKNIMELRKNQL